MVTFLRIQVLIVFAQFIKQHFCASLKVIWLDFEINIKNNNKLEAQQGQSWIKTKMKLKLSKIIFVNWNKAEIK